jgi:release factor glutamine methyltransferase
MYEPREDSFLLLRNLKKHIKKDSNVLEMGAGSGILAIEASKKAKKVIACDIDENAIKLARISAKGNKKIKFIQSDLFSKIMGKFDIILFNPPYLPSKEIKYIDLDGGKNGTEVIEKFLKQAKKYLKKEGKIILLTSSFNKNIEKIFKKYNYNYGLIDEEKLFFERLFIWLLS